MSSLLDLKRKREEEISLSPSMKEAIVAKNKQNASKGLQLAKARRDAPAGKLSGKGAPAAGAGVAALQAAGVGGEGAGSAESAAMGAASGAMTGSMIAPGIGTAVGAVVGGTIGLLKSRSARKKRAREAAAKAHANIAQIEQQKSGKIAGALENIRAGFQSSLVRNTNRIQF
jgi:hypothetical protein